MADTSLLIHVDQTDALNVQSRDGKVLLRKVIKHLERILIGSKRANLIKVFADGVDPVQASGTITVATALVNDTVTINGVVFTAKAVANQGNNEFSQAGSDSADATSLAAIINGSTSAAISGIVTAAAVGAVVTVTCAIPGGIGNSITLASSGATLAIGGVSNGRLSGGAGHAVTPTTITL